MEIGTAEPIIPRKKLRRRLTRTSGGNGPTGGNGKNGGGDDGGDDSFRRRNDFADAMPSTPDKAKVVTWFLLLVVVMTFAGMIGAYIVIATNATVEWHPFDLPIQVWFSTLLILVSSFTYHVAKKAFDDNEQAKARKWIIATTALGAAFISSQLLVWIELTSRGLYMQGNPYAGFFYIMTAAHAIHVVGGIIALGAILLRSWYETSNTDELTYRRNLSRSVGWYWHFMGGLWIVLFVLLGFWK
jgi:cytochrome c oxidase subunit 3